MMRRVSTRTLCATASRTASLVGTRISAWLVDHFIVVVLIIGAVDKTKISAWLVDLFIVVVLVVLVVVGVVVAVDETKISAWLVDLFVADVAFVEE